MVRTQPSHGCNRGSTPRRKIYDGNYILFSKNETLKRNDVVLVDKGKNRKFLRTFESKTSKNFKVRMKDRVSYISISEGIEIYKYLEKVKIVDVKRFDLQNRRYIGNKYKIIDWIFDLIDKNCTGNSFVDLFAGTAVISKAAVEKYTSVVINDFLYSNHLIHKAFFSKESFNDNKLKQQIENFNLINPNKLKENYFSINFGGKYFSKNDAKVIGHIREYIKKNKNKYTNKEYSVLLASLIYSVDKISNTVGHYDAYFKKKNIKDRFILNLIRPLKIKNKVTFFRKDSNLLVKKLKADIVYIDPPYNSRQYSRFYHLLETLTKWQKNKLFGVALKPGVENMSDYCRKNARDKFSDLVNSIDAKHIVVSYNNTYFSKSKSSKNKITLNEIRTILNRRGTTKVFSKDYRCFNSGGTEFKDHKEYLFITEISRKKIKSPLFYIGDKYKILDQIQSKFPENINSFYEPFLGGGSVFLNTEAKRYYLNDLNEHIINIHKTLINYSNKINMFHREVDIRIKKYSLSKSYKENIISQSLKKKYQKTYFAQFNKVGYTNLKKKFNKQKQKSYLDLYLLLIYGFNRMVRFNSKGEFNLPVGNVDFNKNVMQALNNYFTYVNQKKINITKKDFSVFLNNKKYQKNDFVYFDPPYLITSTEYNKLWNLKKEADLLKIIDEMDKKKVKFALSNVTFYKGRKNQLLIDWMKKYNVYKIKSNYINYHDNKKKYIEEVLITNY